jgi:hypothetical protein
MEASDEKASPPHNGPLSPELEPKPLDSTSSTSPEKSPTPDLRVTAPVEGDPKPVSFFTLFRSVLVSSAYPFVLLTFSLFRFSTRTELVLNGFSLVAAVAAGAAQVRA